MTFYGEKEILIFKEREIMKYYQNEDFLIVATDSNDMEMSLQEICTIGLNLLVQLESNAPHRACACLEHEQGIYAIFPKIPSQLTDSVIRYLIEKLQSEGISFEKEDVDCSAIQLEPLSRQQENAVAERQALDRFLQEIFGLAGKQEEAAEEQQTEVEEETETQEGETQSLYKVCTTIEMALGMAKQLQLEDFSIIEYREKWYLVTKSFDAEKTKFQQFIRNHYRIAFLKEHGTSYYEHSNYRELESLSFLDTVAME